VSAVNRSDVIPSRLQPAPPAFIAAGYAHGVRLQDQRKCLHCTQAATRGKLVCRRHGGRLAHTSDAHGRGERRKLDRMDRIGLIPVDLMALPVWRALSMLPTSVRSPLRLHLVMMWAEREAEPLAWARLLRQAQHAAETIAPGYARVPII